jgi:phosphoribosylglycinamide formyltransferase-1
MGSNIAVFASGTGTNTDAIIRFFASDDAAQVALVVSSRHDAGVLNVAERYGVPSVVVDRTVMEDEEVLTALLEAYNVHFIVLAGWLRLIPLFLVRAFERRMLNIHPALLPKFGGKGMWGRKVHEAVKDAGESVSGITIHEVNEAYDEGKIVAQFETSIDPADDVDSIERKVRALELEHYPQIIKKYIIALMG